MPENHGRIVGEPIVQDVNVGPADAREVDVDLHPVCWTGGFGHVDQVDITRPALRFNECFHDRTTPDWRFTDVLSCCYLMAPGLCLAAVGARRLAVTLAEAGREVFGVRETGTLGNLLE